METWFGTMLGFAGVVALVLSLPLQLVTSFTIAAGIAIPLALVLTGPLITAGWKHGTRRERVITLTNVTPTAAADALPVVTDLKHDIRLKAANTVANIASSGPGKIITESTRTPDDVFTYLIDGMDKRGDSAYSCATAFTYFARDYPDTALTFEQDLLDRTTDAPHPIAARVLLGLTRAAAQHDAITTEYTDAAVGLADSHDPDAREDIVTTLGMINTARAHRHLTQLAADPNPDVSQHAQTILDNSSRWSS